MTCVLGGDIGGTKTLLQLAEFAPGAARPARILHEARYDSAAWDDLAPMVRAFLADAPTPPRAACFGVAGPVAGNAATQTAHLTNLPWQLDSRRLAAALDLPAVRLINDFEAVGHGVETLAAEDLATLVAAPARAGAPRVVLGAGTGLGVALLLPCAGGYTVLPTEGGHADLAPADAQQAALLAFLQAELGHVSWERVLSGPGLANLYRFLLRQQGEETTADPLLVQPDPAAAIAAADTALAEAAVEMFMAFYGACAGNLALTCLAYGGVYLAGGIAPKLLPRLQRGTFARTYTDKGRMSALVRAMPVHVITHPQVGLRGALLAASRL